MSETKAPRPRNLLIAEFEGLSKEDASQALRDAGGDLEKARALVRRRRANPDDTDDDEPAVKAEEPPPPPSDDEDEEESDDDDDDDYACTRAEINQYAIASMVTHTGLRRVAQQPLRQEAQSQKIQEALGRRKGAAQGGARPEARGEETRGAKRKGQVGAEPPVFTGGPRGEEHARELRGQVVVLALCG